MYISESSWTNNTFNSYNLNTDVLSKYICITQYAEIKIWRLFWKRNWQLKYYVSSVLIHINVYLYIEKME